MSQLEQLEQERALVEEQIRANNGSDRDKLALRALIQRSKELGRQIYLLKRQSQRQRP